MHMHSITKQIAVHCSTRVAAFDILEIMDCEY